MSGRNPSLPAQKTVVFAFTPPGVEQTRRGEWPVLFAASSPQPLLSDFAEPDSPLLRKLSSAGVEPGSKIRFCAVSSTLSPTGLRSPEALRESALDLGAVKFRQSGRKETFLLVTRDLLEDLFSPVADSGPSVDKKTDALSPAQRRHTKRGHPSADALDWDESVSLTKRLLDDDRPRDAALIAIGCYLGLRISDILPLRWCDLEGESLTLREKKTGKLRSMKINPALSAILLRCRNAVGAEEYSERYIFESWVKEYKHPVTRQAADGMLKRIREDYGIKSAKVFSCHSLRKTFGRRVWLQECEKGRGEQALYLLCEVFGHANVNITKRYLGIRQEEILSVYDSLTK